MCLFVFVVFLFFFPLLVACFFVCWFGVWLGGLFAENNFINEDVGCAYK